MHELLIAPFAEFGFLRRALVGCLAVSTVAPVLGVFLMLRRMSLTADVLAHGILPGVAGAFLLAGLSVPALAFGGLLAGLAVAVGAGALSRATGGREDAALAALYLVALALGVVLVSWRGGAVELTQLLFGSALGVDDAALLLMAGSATLTLGVLALAWRPLVLECFDPGFAAAVGARGASWHLGFLALGGAEPDGRLPGARHPDGGRADDAAGDRGAALGAQRGRHGLRRLRHRRRGLRRGVAPVLPRRPADGAGGGSLRRPRLGRFRAGGAGRRPRRAMAAAARTWRGEGQALPPPAASTKPCTRPDEVRRQPSTRTKKISFIGRDTALGGSIIMPSDMRRLATTMSMTRKGRKTRKPISKARFSSPTRKAGKSTRQATACPSAGSRSGLPREVPEQGKVGLAGLGLHEGAEGLGRGLEPVHLADPAGHHRLQPFRPAPLQGRLHHEEGQEQREPDHHRVRRDALGADGGAQERQHHDDARKGGRHDEERRGEGEQPDQRRELHQARGVARPAGRAEVDADALRGGRGGGSGHQKGKGEEEGAHHAASPCGGGTGQPAERHLGRAAGEEEQVAAVAADEHQAPLGVERQHFLNGEPATGAAGLGAADGHGAQGAEGREGEQHHGAERQEGLEAEGRVERHAVVSYRRTGFEPRARRAFAVLARDGRHHAAPMVKKGCRGR